MEIKPLLAVTQRQYGCITWSQALDLMTKTQFVYLIKKQAVTRVHPAVYIISGSTATWQQRAMAATLSLSDAMLSHRSAARLWGLHMVASEKISVTSSAKSSTYRQQVRLHQSEQIEGFATIRHGISVTTVARTLVDLSACLPEKKLAAALDQACNAKLVTHAEISNCLEQMTTQGRSGVTRLRRLLTGRTETDERLDSFLERKVLRWIRAADLPEPVGQFPVLANGNFYRLDLAYPEKKVVVEPDGPHHLLASVASDDRLRDVDLALAGWLVLHVSRETDREIFLTKLRQALASNSD